MYIKNITFFCYLFGFFSCLIIAQELPPIQNYSPQDYSGETQNWSISQDNSNTIYIANNKGLLQFNGEKWQLFPSPNQSIIRSTKVINERIYTGMYMEFGYWLKDEFGALQYQSLSNELSKPLIEEEQFWNIEALDNWILFQSLNRIYIYNTDDKSFNIIESDSGITKMYKVKDEIYFQKNSKGLFKISNGRSELITSNPTIAESRLINIFNINNNLLLQTQESGFYLLKNNKLQIWNKNLNNVLKTKSIYNSIKLNDGKYALGSISTGLILIDRDGNLIYNIDQSKGLGNNTILSLFEDNEKNLWLGSDNGVACLNMNSPIKVFNDDNGLIGSVYTTAIFKDKLFIGTNQGLFFKDFNNNHNFNFIEGTKGQVWNLTIYDNNLFCGHDSGTFLIKNETAKLISNIEGTWEIKPIKSNPNLLIQGNYSGLSVLEKKNSQWKLKNKIDNFNISSRYFEFINDTQLLVSHEYKGIVKLKLDSNLTKAENIEINKELKGLKSSLSKHKSQIYYAYESGIFKYNKSKNTFQKDSSLTQIIKKSGFISGKLITDSSNDRLWFFSKEQIHFIEQGGLTNKPQIRSIYLSNELINSVTGYENILSIGNDNYLIGTTLGYLIINLNNLKIKDYKTSITGISSTKFRSENMLNNTSIQVKGEFSNNQNNLEFDYTINEYNRYFKAEYQYQLIGKYNNWSSWSRDSKQIFENLPYGEYTFNVRGKINNKVTDNVASYQFTIDRPWYISNFMIAQYVVVLLLFSLFMHYTYKRYYKNQREKLITEKNKEIELKDLANKQQYMSFKNEKLKHDIENKNRELAISTMSLIKKNEFLSTVKNELKKADSSDLKNVIKIIDTNLNNTNDWKLFKEAFNNADKDFLKKIKAKHASLTPNDLKLCAYLRLNLSSKEIAPLLNISPRSVEVKRYRLRKKMNLPHEASLTNYILEI